MAKGKFLTDFEKGQIFAHHQNGKGFREISRLINRSDKVIRNFLKNPDKYGQNKSSGRPEALTKRDSQHILKEVSKKLIYISKFKSN